MPEIPETTVCSVVRKLHTVYKTEEDTTCQFLQRLRRQLLENQGDDEVR